MVLLFPPLLISVFLVVVHGDVMSVESTYLEIGIDAQGRDPDIITSQSSSTKEQLHCLQQR